MLDLRDEEMVHLLSLGGWIRGLEIGAASVAADFSPERASKLRQLDLLDYYLQRLDTLSPPLKSTPLISQIISGLKEVRQKLGDTPAVSQEDVSGIQTTARNLVALIEGGTCHRCRHPIRATKASAVKSSLSRLIRVGTSSLVDCASHGWG